MRTPLFPFLGGGITQSAAIDRLVAQQTLRVDTGTTVTIAAGGETVVIGDGTNDITVNLPAVSATTIVTLEKNTIDGKKVTLHRVGSEKINGVVADYVLPASIGFGRWVINCNGTDWYANGGRSDVSFTSSSTTPSVTAAFSATSLKLSSASNIAITFDSSTLFNGFRLRVIKSNSGTNTITAVGTGSSKVYVLDGSPSAATPVNLMNDTSTLRPHWDIICDGTDYYIG